jgi:3-hydroxyacyl-[acyl-carrier-protein] dehydratase
MTSVAEAAVVVTGTVHVDPDDPVFAGHYPGFPILPGLFVVEHVHAVVRASTALAGLRPTALPRAKFTSPVFPGDDLTVEATLTRGEDGVRCFASVSTASGPVAEIRLRYS